MIPSMEDRLEIQDLLFRYARAADQREASVASGDQAVAELIVGAAKAILPERLAVAIEKLKALHYVGKAALALSAEEFAATTGLDAETYEKAVAK